MPTSKQRPIPPRYPLGRITPTPEQARAMRATMGLAPSVLRGELPRQSPPLWQYRLPRYRHQEIGCCVGESGAALAETTCRTPPGGIGLAPAPVEGTPAFSPLWVYYLARKYSADQGRPIRGEGAILSDAMAAVQAEGFVLYDAWEPTSKAYANYNDKAPASALQAHRYRVAGEVRQLGSADHILEYLAAGYSVWVGVPWRGGWTTGPNGYFPWRSSSIGGHAVELLGYDLDRDLVWIGNSWDPWGLQPGGIGLTDWSALRKDLTERMLSRGGSEAVVITEVDWRPAPVPMPTPSVIDITCGLGGVIYSGRLTQEV